MVRGKKTVVLFVLIALLLVPATIVLAGGGQEAAETQPGQIVELEFWKEAAGDKKIDDAVRGWCQEYQRNNPNVRVELATVPFDQFLGDKLPTALASGTLPDVFWPSPGYVLQLLQNDVLMPLESYIPESVRKDFYPGSLEAVTFNGHIVAIPVEKAPLALYYNQQHMQDSGLQAPETWAELVDAGQKLKTPNRAGLYVETRPGVYQIFTWYPFLWQGGGSVFDDHWEKPLFKGDAASNALQLWGDFINKYKISPTVTDEGTWAVNEFINQKTSMQVCGNWAYARLERGAPEFPVALAPLPHPEGKKSISVAGGMVVVANKQSDHAEEAARFVTTLFASEDVTVPIDWNYGVNSKISPRISANEKAPQASQKPNSFFRDAIMPVALPEPLFPTEVSQILIDALQSVMFGDVTGKDAADQANARLAEFLDNYQGPRP